MRSSSNRILISAIAGAFAAAAGILGKFGADGDTSAIQHLETLCNQQQQTLALLFVSCATLAALVRALSIVLMLVANAVMLRFFVKGLHETDSLTATVTSASVNFMLSAAGGHAAFREHLPLQWFAGATLILVGMGCVLHGDSRPSVAAAGGNHRVATSTSTSTPSRKPKQT